ncbi:MAG: PilZ domain-containing protein [Deltaproteobacteria bacterium]|nr:PilZ domain-containing protein [Deltaproteobacteria bacterium]MBW2118679.1 PilZ domain-containing protein [Deltaproteobacteria bacterium]MBW2343418.1 PilZ domain-containing protein [Deltaproteobacteria bacterium]
MNRPAESIQERHLIFSTEEGVTEQEKAELLIKKGEPIETAPGETNVLPPPLFQHQDLTHADTSNNLMDQEALINILNYTHFTNGHILVNLRHPRYQDSIFLKARPDPCLGRELVCRWSDENISSLDLEKYEFQHIVIGNGQSVTIVPAVLKEINNEYLKIHLPDTSHIVGQRRAKRYACHDVGVELIQNGLLARGELVDFSPDGFRIDVRPDLSSSFHWFNPDEPVSIHLHNQQRTFFSGICLCIRQGLNLKDKEIVLAPSADCIKRFKSNQTRNPRQHLVPPPTLILDHPLTKKRVQLGVSDISTSGFSVYEKADDGILLPGMIIPDMVIAFAGSLRMNCDAQVIYRMKDDENGVRCGLAILDMDINNYSHLTHILTSALDSYANVSSEIDMDALWEFFFDSGFIYPKKYGLIQSHREAFKKTYKKLYQENPEVARHFTYQRNGRIYGHISMVRAYDKAWMIHHHAALIMEHKRAGFIVLKQIMHYLNDMHRLPSAKIDYVMSYFRPENKFPDRVFGGFARTLDNPKGCSVDTFAYLPYTSLSLGARLPDEWNLRECSALDLWELNRFYNHSSGGLLLDAMALGNDDSGDEPLEKVYDRLGFLRKQKAYSLTSGGKLKAVLIVNQSDLGFNLSELLNSIKILVTDPEVLPWNVLSIAISRLTGVYHMGKVPVLFYPFDYVKVENVPYEKQYQAWVLNVRYGNEYMEYMQKRFRIGYK